MNIPSDFSIQAPKAFEMQLIINTYPLESDTHQFSAVFTARKRSLGPGNVFIGVCQEFCPRGVCFSACWDTTPPPRAGLPPEQAPRAPGTRHPPEQSMPGDTVNEWAVRILLECILVLKIFYTMKSTNCQL